MSRLYTADGKRRSSMSHAKHSWRCSCGRIVRGNGGRSSHRKACDGYYLTTSERNELARQEWETAQGTST